MSFNRARHIFKRVGLDLLVSRLEIRVAILRHVLMRQGYAQHGEDKFLLRYFQNKPNGLFIDIGANNPVLLSSTFLLYQLGWSGIVVDPIRRYEILHRRYRPRDYFLNAAAGSSDQPMLFHEMIPDVFSTFDFEQARKLQGAGALLLNSYSVPVVSLASILQRFCPREIDFLSIDAEGCDHDVLQSNDWNKYRPLLIGCEVDKWPDHLDYFASIGYSLVANIGCNSFYERSL